MSPSFTSPFPSFWPLKIFYLFAYFPRVCHVSEDPCCNLNLKRKNHGKTKGQVTDISDSQRAAKPACIPSTSLEKTIK